MTWLLFILIDGLILLAAGGTGEGSSWIGGVSYARKLLAALGGGGVAACCGKSDLIAEK